MLREGRRDEASRRMHSLKGIACTLSATDVCRLSGTLERLLAGPASPAEEPLLDALDHACDVISRAVAPLIRDEPEALPAAPGESDQSPAPLIRELRRLVGRDNPRALDVAKQLKGNAGLATVAGPHLAALEAHLSVFDFEQAASIVGALAAELGEVGELDEHD